MGQATQQQPKPGTTSGAVSVAGEPGALEFKRAELRDQLKELRTRRNELLEQRAVVNEPQRQLLDGRIANIDKRSAQLETQLFAMNDLIAQAVPVSGIPTPPPGGLLVDQSTTQPPVDLTDLRLVAQDAVFEAMGMSTMAILSVYVLYRGFRRYIWKRQPEPALRDPSAQLIQLQQSMDVIALEVERISEAQRYTAKLLSDKGDKIPSLKP
jgi:hypothetical protein